jgi:hypothetical protein
MEHAKDMKDIHACVICRKSLVADREHVDTCSKRCFKRLLVQQRLSR